MRHIYVYLIITLLLSSFIGCAKNIEEKYPNGNIKYTGTMKSGKMVDKWTYYYESGKVRAEGYYKDGDGTDTSSITGIPRNGRFGNWKFYRENGKLEAEYNFISKDKFSYTKYYENGNIELTKETELNNGDTLFVKGYGYLENGTKDEDMYKRNDTVTFTSYYDNGQVNNISTYYKNSLILELKYNKKGEYIGKLKLTDDIKWLTIYYTEKVDSNIALNISKFYFENLAKPENWDEEDAVTCFVNKELGSYQYGFAIKEGIHNDQNVINYFKYLNKKCSKTVLKGEDVETALCDSDLNILRIVP